MTPRSEALAFRIWAYCHPLGWDTTVSDIADALDVDAGRVGKILKAKGWTQRLRASGRDVARDAWFGGHSVDAEMEGVGG